MSASLDYAFGSAARLLAREAITTEAVVVKIQAWFNGIILRTRGYTFLSDHFTDSRAVTLYLIRLWDQR